MEQQIARKERPTGAECVCAREAPRGIGCYGMPPGRVLVSLVPNKGPKGPTHATNNTREPRRAPAALSDLPILFRGGRVSA